MAPETNTNNNNNWLSFSLSPMEMLTSSSSSQSQMLQQSAMKQQQQQLVPFDVASADPQQYCFFDNYSFPTGMYISCTTDLHFFFPFLCLALCLFYRVKLAQRIFWANQHLFLMMSGESVITESRERYGSSLFGCWEINYSFSPIWFPLFFLIFWVFILSFFSAHIHRGVSGVFGINWFFMIFYVIFFYVMYYFKMICLDLFKKLFFC